MGHKSKNRLGGFSLMELLVIVVIMGVLATVALPKYRKVLESRKTTEAESILSAVRTEQERRCAMDKPYITEFTKLSELVPSSESNHYSYTLLSSGKGMRAMSKGDFSYELRMPSYADGRICCSGEACGQLSKDYPSCDSMTDIKYDNSCLDGITPNAAETGPTVGCLGVAPADETYTCPQADGLCGTRTRSYSCDKVTLQWVPGNWEGECTPKRGESVTEKRACPTSGGMMGHGPTIWERRMCTVTYDCNGVEESRDCGDWLGCPTGGNNGYRWKLMDDHTIGPLSAALIAPLIPPLPNPVAPGNIIGPEHIIAACAIGGTIGTMEGSSWPSAPCNASTVGSEERTYVFRLAPWWAQFFGPPVCEVLVSDYMCVVS